MAYDKNNIFARILRKELPAKSIYENEYAFAFHDIFPKAPIHVLVIPKGEFENFSEFSLKASPEQIHGFTQAIQKVVDSLDLNKRGFRLISNQGLEGGQEVPHYHVHILGGKPLGGMLPES